MATPAVFNDQPLADPSYVDYQGDFSAITLSLYGKRENFTGYTSGGVPTGSLVSEATWSHVFTRLSLRDLAKLEVNTPEEGPTYPDWSFICYCYPKEPLRPQIYILKTEDDYAPVVGSWHGTGTHSSQGPGDVVLDASANTPFLDLDSLYAFPGIYRSPLTGSGYGVLTDFTNFRYIGPYHIVDEPENYGRPPGATYPLPGYPTSTFAATRLQSADPDTGLPEIQRILLDSGKYPIPLLKFIDFTNPFADNPSPSCTIPPWYGVAGAPNLPIFGGRRFTVADQYWTQIIGSSSWQDLGLTDDQAATIIRWWIECLSPTDVRFFFLLNSPIALPLLRGYQQPYSLAIDRERWKPFAQGASTYLLPDASFPGGNPLDWTSGKGEVVMNFRMVDYPFGAAGGDVLRVGGSSYGITSLYGKPPDTPGYINKGGKGFFDAESFDPSFSFNDEFDEYPGLIVGGVELPGAHHIYTGSVEIG